ncbi:MAG: isochorismatase family protein [Nitrospinae bacterium]|nr:isochorismatase family protein [Nitrospinota bacterium]
MSAKEALFENIAKAINGAKAMDMPILWAEQVPHKLGHTIPQISGLLGGLSPVAKNCFSCMGDDKFVNALNATGRRNFLISGIEAHVCVYQTVRDMLAQGYNVEIMVDAVSSRDPENKRVGIEKMKDLGASITSVEMALFDLLASAESPYFKDVWRIVK